MNTLEKESNILLEKAKFLLFRMVSYFSFLLVPILTPKVLELPSLAHVFLMIIYSIFITGQWFLLGKEIDYRLKIYYRLNSSLDRIIYRIIAGMSVFILYFYILSFLPVKWINNLFWLTWVVLGLFYSWPTRGKIVRESMTSNFSEFKHLDAFEKTLLFLIITAFVVSIPTYPNLTNMDAIKLFIDPNEQVSDIYWTFLKVNYYPFVKYPNLFSMSLFSHIYLIVVGLFLIGMYTLHRFFMSRRISILSIFVLLSSWSFYRFLSQDIGLGLTSVFPVLAIWSFFWCVKSSSYKSGLFSGIMIFLGSLISIQSYVFAIGIVVMILFYLFTTRTRWFCYKYLRYVLFGFILSIFVQFSHNPSEDLSFALVTSPIEDVLGQLQKKGFFILSIFGVIYFLLKLYSQSVHSMKVLDVERLKLRQLSYVILMLILLSFFKGLNLITGMTLLWLITFFSVFTIESIFIGMARFRSKRNLVYLAYIVMAILDSRLEGRVKTFLTFINQ